jgi:hypothetical protein
MNKAHALISSAGTLTITAQHVTGQAPVTSGGEKIPINYLSGAVYAKQHFTVPKGGGLVFSASFKAPVGKGVCPHSSIRTRIVKVLIRHELDMACLLAHRRARLAARDRHGRVERQWKDLLQHF